MTRDEFIAGIQARAAELKRQEELGRPAADPLITPMKRGRGRPPKPILDESAEGDADLIAAAFDPIEELEENDGESL